MYIADTSNHRIRKVTVSTSVITTIAGTGASGYTGDNGAATSATLNNPDGVAVDASGRIIITISLLYCVFGAVSVPLITSSCLSQATCTSLTGQMFVSAKLRHIPGMLIYFIIIIIIIIGYDYFLF